MDPYCYCFVSVMLSCLFNAALWSSAGIGLTSLFMLNVTKHGISNAN